MVVRKVGGLCTAPQWACPYWRIMWTQSTKPHRQHCLAAYFCFIQSICDITRVPTNPTPAAELPKNRLLEAEQAALRRMQSARVVAATHSKLRVEDVWKKASTSRGRGEPSGLLTFGWLWVITLQVAANHDQGYRA